jgi:hypothetical protein
MLTSHHMYYYSLSHGLTLVSFPRIKHVFFFIVGRPLDVRFEMDLESDAVVWCSDIDLVMLKE